MKQFSLWMLVLMLTALLVSCAAGRYPYSTTNLADESWRSQMTVNPNAWTQKADSWFREGRASLADYRNATAPFSEAISREAVRVPNFHNIKIQGDFKVQMAGGYDATTVCVEGPNAAVRSIAVVVRGDTLILEQAKNAPLNMDRVVVHITMKNLNSLSYTGAGLVEGVRLFSNHLTVESNAMGNIFLAGHLNVKCVAARNCGSVTIFTVNSSQTEIVTTSMGDVNIKAECKVGLSAIRHYGAGNINVVNAAGSRVMIEAKGRGRINIIGCIGVKEIRASDHACVFVSNSMSSAPCIYVADDARVGIAGRAHTMHAYTTRTAKLMARYLVADAAYVEASGMSHMNICATDKVFATARDYSTIYFYGDPDIVESFQKNSGAVIMMNEGMAPASVVKRSKHRYHRTADTLNPGIRMGENDHILWPTRSKFALAT